MSKIIRKIQGILTLFVCLTNVNWVNSSKCPYGFNLNSNLRYICKWLCNWLLLNGTANTLWPWTSHYNIDHVLEHCIIFIPWLLCLLDRRATGIGGHPLRWRHRYRTSSARQATPPLIMSIKTQFPLFLLCMIRMITLCRFLPHSWTHILCMAYHSITIVSKPQS